jgi:lipoprotein-anchoring transpeptidase ErfK/SrfK
MKNSSRPISRRAFLTAAGGAVAAGFTLPRALRGTAAAPAGMGAQPDDAELAFVQPKPARLDLWGRITDPGTPVYSEPARNKVDSYIAIHTVVPILEVLEGEALNGNNPTWYRIAQGYVYTRNMQILHPYRMPTPITQIDTQIRNVLGDLVPGFWGDIIVPFTTARTEAGGATATLIDGNPIVVFYGTTHRVTEAKPDRDANLWYKVIDDRKGADPFWVLARHMRRIMPHDLAPINLGADKRIEVSIEKQQINCFENGNLVFSTYTSSGGDGFDTPKGDWSVVYKQVSRHMYDDPENALAGDSNPNYFDLPGVPFNIFFTTMGHAIHGTFWHGDYGRPRSHGCLNVTPENARWIFRWVEPVAPYEDLASGSSANPGTPVIVT